MKRVNWQKILRLLLVLWLFSDEWPAWTRSVYHSKRLREERAWERVIIAAHAPPKAQNVKVRDVPATYAPRRAAKMSFNAYCSHAERQRAQVHEVRPFIIVLNEGGSYGDLYVRQIKPGAVCFPYSTLFSDRFSQKRVPLLDYYMTTDTRGAAQRKNNNLFLNVPYLKVKNEKKSKSSHLKTCIIVIRVPNGWLISSHAIWYNLCLHHG